MEHCDERMPQLLHHLSFTQYSLSVDLGGEGGFVGEGFVGEGVGWEGGGLGLTSR